MINLELLKNPFNWIIVLLMIFIAWMGATFTHKFLTQSKEN